MILLTCLDAQLTDNRVSLVLGDGGKVVGAWRGRRFYRDWRETHITCPLAPIRDGKQGEALGDAWFVCTIMQQETGCRLPTVFMIREEG